MKQLDGIVINVYGRQSGKTYRQIKNKVITDIIKEINKHCYWNNDDELRIINNIKTIIERYRWED